MAYLESIPVVHADLASRNILVVAEDSEVSVKITDFGLAQSSITVRIYQVSATVGRGAAGEATLS